MAIWFLSFGIAAAQTTTLNGGIVTVPGDRPNPWNITGVLQITNGGVLNIEEGGSVTTSQNITVGTAPGNDGTIDIDNGSLRNVHSYIGSGGSTGIISVSGEDASWNATRTIQLGHGGIGHLTIEGGGTVVNGGSGAGGGVHHAILGSSEGSDGTAIVTGSGSSWTTRHSMFVGNAGSGILTISDGGMVENTAASGIASAIGNQPSGKGWVKVTGPNSQWTSASEIIIGNQGKGTLTVNSGGVVKIADDEEKLVVASQSGSAGTLIIGAAEGEEAVAPGIVLANTIAFGAGEGSLVFNHTGTDYAFDPTITGSETGGSASIYVISGFTEFTGKSSAFTGDVNVAGGTLAITGELGSAEVSISNGSLDVTGGGILLSSANSYVGRETGSTASSSVSGADSEWTIGGDLVVGDDGEGSLAIDSGALVHTANGYVAFSAGSEGSVVVRGDGSKWISPGEIHVGRVGSGSLLIENGGFVESQSALIASGAALFAGDFGNSPTIIQGNGNVQVTGRGSVWRTNSLDVSVNGTGQLTVSDNGAVEVGQGVGVIRLTSDNPDCALMTPCWLGQGTINIGSPPDKTATSPGKIHADAIQFGYGTGTLNFNHTDSDYRFDSRLMNPEGGGVASVNIRSGLTEFTADSSDFSGKTSISGGIVVVTGKLGGQIEVSSEGVLAGAGTVGDTTIVSGGTISPGMSVGTLHIDGDLTMEEGAAYEVEVNPDGSAADLIHVTGTAYIDGGSVVHVGMDGLYQPLARYTILTADEEIRGQFSGATSDYVFLDPTLGYDANNAFLTLVRNDIEFARYAASENQEASATGLESLDFSNAAYSALAFLTYEVDIRDALDQLSGEFHASAKAARILRAERLRSAVLGRLARPFSAPQISISAYAPDNKLAALGNVTGNGVTFSAWTDAWGQWGRFQGNGNASGVKHTNSGFLVGADVTLDQRWRVGVFSGYGRAEERADELASSGNSSDLHFGLYGGAELDALKLAAGAAYTFHSLDTKRHVTFPGFTERLEASYNARTTQVFAEAGYRFHAGASASFKPFAGLAYVHHETEAFSESGNNANLQAERSSDAMTFGTIGLRGETGLDIAGNQTILRVMAAWQHSFDEFVPTSTYAFSGGSPFTISGSSISRNAALVEAGIDVNLGMNASLGLSYLGRISNDMDSHGVNAHFRMTFGG